MGLATLVFCGCAHRGGHPIIYAETIPLSDMPVVVERAVRAEFPDAEILWVGRFGSDTDSPVYSVKFQTDGKCLATSIDVEGKMGRVYEPSNR
jgi:hypothetical protein